MKRNHLLFFIFLSSFLPSANADVVWSEDFDTLDVGTVTATNRNIGNVQCSNTLTSEVVAAPAEFTLASGNALLLSAGASNFSAIRPASSFNPINLPAIADGLTWSISFDIYIPAELVEEVGGMASFRWKDGGANTVNGPADNTFQTLSAGEHHIEYSGTFPIDIGNGPFLPTNARPFINFDQAGGEVANFVYFDNLVFDVGVSDDDPNLDADPVNFGVLVQGESPYTRPMTIANSGTANNLIITDASITGANATEFSMSNAIFPIEIDPGDSEVIEISFNPADGLGDFVAEMVIASNDESQPSTTLSLNGSVAMPFEGRELIVNGDFESGDLTGWREDERYAFTGDQTRAGAGAAVYTTVAAQEFGNTRLATEPPLGIEGDPVALVISPEMIGKNYEYSAWYYRPSDSGMADTDQIATIFRWNKINVNTATHGNPLVGEIPVDTWIRVVGQGVIPEVGGDGLATTSVEPVWSYRDHGADNPGGLMMFIDDVSFKVDVPPLDPEHPPLEITNIEVDTEDGVVRITWPSLDGATYALDRGPQLDYLEDWPEEEDSIKAAGATHTFEDTTALSQEEARLFYRVRLLKLPE